MKVDEAFMHEKTALEKDECGKIAPNGYPCFLPKGHATPAPGNYPTPRYDASPEEIEKYKRARFGCIGRKPKGKP